MRGALSGDREVTAEGSKWSWFRPPPSAGVCRRGKPNNGERLVETALREVSEETGLSVQLDQKIGVMRYSFPSDDRSRIDKAVHFWLMKPTGGALSDHDDEHIDVRWFGLGEALRLVSYRNTVSILEDAAEMLTGQAEEK